MKILVTPEMYLALNPEPNHRRTVEEVFTLLGIENKGNVQKSVAEAVGISAVMLLRNNAQEPINPFLLTESGWEDGWGYPRDMTDYADLIRMGDLESSLPMPVTVLRWKPISTPPEEAGMYLLSNGRDIISNAMFHGGTFHFPDNNPEKWQYWSHSAAPDHAQVVTRLNTQNNQEEVPLYFRNKAEAAAYMGQAAQEYPHLKCTSTQLHFVED